jgi:hypothetical protein
MRLKLASGDIDLYFCIWIGVAEGLFIFLVAPSIFHVLPAILQKLVDSQISSGDSAQNLS